MLIKIMLKKRIIVLRYICVYRDNCCTFRAELPRLDARVRAGAGAVTH